VDAVNQLTLPLAAVVWAYRGQYRVEDDWSRLKGGAAVADSAVPEFGAADAGAGVVAE
jgi:hypothetical protein